MGSRKGAAVMIILVMGVSGSGKTSIGKRLAEALGWSFFDADDFHPPANVEKMGQGVPLNDRDRAPWLAILQRAIAQWLQEGKNVVLACSLLKASYRHQLCVDPDQVQLVYLQGSFSLIQQRLADRQGHFMKVQMLKSQFADLEEPPDGIRVDVAQPPGAIVAEILDRFKLP
jgi:gluconokinase